MQMKKSVHPGKLIRANLDELRLSVSAAAKRLRVTRYTLSKVINGTIPISWKMALRLSKSFGGLPDTWLKMQFNYNLTQIGKLKRSIKLKRYHADDRVGA